MSKGKIIVISCLIIVLSLSGLVIISEKKIKHEGYDDAMNPTESISVETDDFSDLDTSQKVTSLDNMTGIPANMFKGCIDLQKMDIPENITKIGNNAFHLPDTV